MIFRSARRVVGVAVLLVCVVVLAGCGGSVSSAPPTVRVGRASVSTGVSAAGSVSSSAQSNLGFARGGQLTAVDVRVGDVVRAGQVLASIDDFPARQALRQAESGLAGQQANLDRVSGSPAVSGADRSLSQADRVVAASQRVVDATLRSDDRTIAQAQAAYDKALAAQAQAQAKFAQTQQACQAYQASMMASGMPSGGMSSGMPSGGMSPGMSGGSMAPGSGAVACTLLPGAQMAVGTAQQGVGQALSTLQQARNKRGVDAASGQLQVEQARTSSVSAQNGQDSAQADRNPMLDAARAAVAGARVGVANAARDLANTTLRAPVDGRITALNGAVGEYLAPSSGTTPSAPGGDAPIPGAASGAGAGGAALAGAGGGGGGASPSRPGGSQFLVEQGTSGFSVVAPFQQNDAAGLAPGQRVELSVDAVPDATLEGRVTSVAPSGTEIASVINYYVTIAVTSPDQRLRDGQSVTATVITGEVRDMLSVPNSAVIRQGQRTSVIRVGPDGAPTPTPFSAGLMGADRTEVLGGLADGEQVLAAPTGSGGAGGGGSTSAGSAGGGGGGGSGSGSGAGSGGGGGGSGGGGGATGGSGGGG